MTHSKQSGLVSIIVVMFTAILLMVVSTGFIRIMVQEESRASNNNLSRTAYESAVAGVEDGKRAIMACQRGGSASAACKAIAAKRIPLSLSRVVLTYNTLADRLILVY